MDISSSDDPPPLRCAMGWHDPEPQARWNDGYYFTHCRRCRTDLVRTADGRWRKPRGYRVIWSTERPAGAQAGEVLRPTEERLPIEAVLRHLDQNPPEPFVDERSSDGSKGADGGTGAIDPPRKRVRARSSTRPVKVAVARPANDDEANRLAVANAAEDARDPVEVTAATDGPTEIVPGHDSPPGGSPKPLWSRPLLIAAGLATLFSVADRSRRKGTARDQAKPGR